MIKYHRN